MTSSNENEYLSESERDSIMSLKHLGRKLLKPLPPVHNLLQLLHKLELVLSTVDQAPTKPIQKSLVPSMKALISDEILRHTDEDVKISVTSCFTEITRITAPDAPYDDEQMKEIFKLIVAAFKKLSLASGHCYEKALTILDNVSKVRLCLVMLDLQCDDLVIEMFQHFLRNIRSNHPRNAIDSMETIMTVVLNESEEISSDLLRPLLDGVRNENQTISPISWTLGEKVITNCAVKLKPYLMKAVESSGRALDEYAQIVTSICHNGPESPQHDHSNGSKKTVVQATENTLDVPKDADKQPCDVTEELEPDITCVRDARIMDDTKSNTRSAVASTVDDEMIEKSGSKRKKHSDPTKNTKSSQSKANSKTGNLESVLEPKSETWLNTVPRKRGRKPNSLMHAEEGYDNTWIYKGARTGKPALSRKACNSSSFFPPSKNPVSRKDELQSKAKTASESPLPQKKNENIAKPDQFRKAHDIGSDFAADENPASNKGNTMPKSEGMSEGHEASASNLKADENRSVSSPSTYNFPDESRPKRGRPRKRSSTGIQDVGSKSVTKLKKDNLNPQPESSFEPPGVRLEKESEARKDSEVKPQTSIRKIKICFKNNEKTAVAPELVVAQMESKASFKGVGKHKSVTDIDAENREEGRSSAQSGVKKRRRHNATPNKDLNEAPAIKERITESASKTLNGVEETPQTRVRRRRTTASETRDLGNSLVGSRIKVWWPMDKMFYEGVIDKYDPVKGKHTILYADGEVEVLNLKKQRWELIAVEVSPSEEQGLALHKLAEASDIAQKSKVESELESSKGENIKFRSRGRTSSSISKFESAKSVDTSAALDKCGLADKSMDDRPRTVNAQDTAGKPKSKRMKTGSDIKKNKPKTDDLEKAKAQVA